MDAHIKKVYVPMTETGFYILLCLRTPNHGYGIVQKVKELTEDEVVLGPGTMYGSLSKMEKDGLIEFVREEEKRKIYSDGRGRDRPSADPTEKKTGTGTERVKEAASKAASGEESECPANFSHECPNRKSPAVIFCACKKSAQTRVLQTAS